MKITLARLRNSKEALSRLITQPLPGPTAYRFGKAIKIIDGELTQLEETRVSLVKAYGHQDARGGWLVEPENEMAFNAEFQAVLAQEVEIPVDPILPDQMGSRFEASIADLLALDWLICEPAPKLEAPAE